MKFFAIALMVLSICMTKIYAQTPNSDTVLITAVCGGNLSIRASKKKMTYFLQFGQKKKIKVSQDTLRDSVLSKYRVKIEEGLAMFCKNVTYDQAVFSGTVDLTVKYIGIKFFPPTISSYPVTIDTVAIDNNHYFAMIKTTSNGFILSAISDGVNGGVVNQDIAKWDSTGKILLSFNYAPLNNAPFVHNLDALARLQQKNPKTKTPTYYLLYNSSPTPPTYQLVYSDAPGTGTKTGVIVAADEAAKLVDATITQLKIGAQSLNVQSFKNGGKTTSAKPFIKKGRLIWHQQIPFCVGSSFNLSTSIYSPSAVDSVIVILKYQGQPEIDTVMPIDFSIEELKNLVSSTAKPVGCWNVQTAGTLSNFLFAHTTKYPMMVESFNAVKVNNAGTTDSVSIAEKKDTTPQSAPKNTLGADSVAKYDMLNNITLLNAFNFDFTGKLTSSYLGLFNIFAPDFGYKKIKKKWIQCWGMFAGIEKINYGNASSNGGDSTQVGYFYQYVLKNPLSYNTYTRTIDSGATYYYQYNKYKLSTKITSWSFYFDPTFRINFFIRSQPKDPKVGFYAHLHIELLVNQLSRSISMQTINQDSGLYKSPASPTPMNQYLLPQYNSNSTVITSNFGAGIMLYVSPFRDTLSYFYFQATGGLSFNAPNLNAITTLPSTTDSTGRTTIILPNINTAQVNPRIIYPHSQFFYIFRTSFLQALSNKTQLIIGMSVRGTLPAKTPQYAAYIGLNLDLSILSTLFGNK